jgi:septum site-determining protein MinC
VRSACAPYRKETHERKEGKRPAATVRQIVARGAGAENDGRMKAGRDESGAFEVDGRVAPVTVLRLKTADLVRIEKQLRHVSARQAFPYAPVVVDVAELGEARARELPLHDLAERIRACKLLPVGAANLPPSAMWNAAAAGMAVVQLAAAAEPAPIAEPMPPVAEPAAEPATRMPTMTVRQPVRAGQVVYAERADLVVLAPVNAGAQVIADGHIHIYGPLRGRALAGAQGMTDASIFCLSLEAELISIAGAMLVADDIADDVRGTRAHLYLDDGQIRVRPLL